MESVVGSKLKRKPSMKIYWKAELNTPKNETIKGEDGNPVILESLAYDLLLLSDPRAELSGGAKLKNARLAKRIVAGDEITIEEAQIIRDLVGKYGSPAAVLAVEDLLDPPKE